MCQTGSGKISADGIDIDQLHYLNPECHFWVLIYTSMALVPLASRPGLYHGLSINLGLYCTEPLPFTAACRLPSANLPPYPQPNSVTLRV